jgi:heptaprenyl diphosphate synthase
MDFITSNLEKIQYNVQNHSKSGNKEIDEIVFHVTSSKGKMLRSRLLLSSLYSKDVKKISLEEGIRYASSIELLHIASLVHDDVIDDSSLRRGLITLHEKHSNRIAIYAGDYLIQKAMVLSSENEYDRRLKGMSKSLSTLFKGELLQYVNQGNFDISVSIYLRIISGKTSALFALSAYIGSLKGDKNRPGLYMSLGHKLGMAFQIIDDLIDYDIRKDAQGKGILRDFETSTMSLPMIYLIKFYGKDKIEEIKNNKVNLTTLQSMLIESGAIIKTKELLDLYKEKALKILKIIEKEDGRNILLEEYINLFFMS